MVVRRQGLLALKLLSAFNGLFTQVFHRAKRRWKPFRVSDKMRILVAQVRKQLCLSWITLDEEWTTNQTSVSIRLPTESTTASEKRTIDSPKAPVYSGLLSAVFRFWMSTWIEFSNLQNSNFQIRNLRFGVSREWRSRDFLRNQLVKRKIKNLRLPLAR